MLKDLYDTFGAPITKRVTVDLEQHATDEEGDEVRNVRGSDNVNPHIVEHEVLDENALRAQQAAARSLWERGYNFLMEAEDQKWRIPLVDLFTAAATLAGYQAATDLHSFSSISAFTDAMAASPYEVALVGGAGMSLPYIPHYGRIIVGGILTFCGHHGAARVAIYEGEENQAEVDLERPVQQPTQQVVRTATSNQVVAEEESKKMESGIRLKPNASKSSSLVSSHGLSRNAQIHDL